MWNRAITGERVICLAAMAVVAVWILDGMARRVLRKAREALSARKSVPSTVGVNVFGAPTVHDEAERQARRSVKALEASFWVARLTLAQVLKKKAGVQVQELTVDEAEAKEADAEISSLFRYVLKYAPIKVCDRIRKEHWRYVR